MSNPEWIRRTWEESLALGTRYGLGESELNELLRYLLDGDHGAITTATWFVLDAGDLIGPSGALMADCMSFFWAQDRPAPESD